MPSQSTKSTSITLRADVMERGRTRCGALGYPSFSQYVEALIAMDLQLMQPHVLVRREGEMIHRREEGE